MKPILFLTTLLLILVPLSAQAACPQGNPDWIAYIRRENNRCEGKRDGRDASGSLMLVSFITTNLSKLPNSLVIRVAGNNNPSLEVQEYSSNYRLDEVKMKSSGQSAIFPLDTKIMRKALIDNVKSLLAVAYTIQNASAIYYPIVLGKPSGSYTFVLYSPKPTVFKKIQIRNLSNSTLHLNQSLRQPLDGNISLKWPYSSAPAGDYQLYLEDDRGNLSRFKFKHNPQWL
jgi:hypothetical protein